MPGQRAFEGIEIKPGAGHRFSFTARRSPWIVEGVAEIAGGVVVVTSFTLSADEMSDGDSRQGVTDDVLRSIPVGELRGALARQVVTDTEADLYAEQWGFEVDAKDVKLRRRLKSALALPSEGQRRRLPETFYRDLALLRLDLARTGVTRGVRREMATLLKVEENAIRDWLRTARELGYLAFSGPGSREVEPGERLRAEMSEQVREIRDTKEIPWRT